MTIPRETLDEAEELARAAKPISRIVDILGVDYDEI